MLFDKHNKTLIQDGSEARFEQTHLGMAHLSGTGPKGKTCRECVFYKVGATDPYKTSGELKNGGCKKGLPGQSRRTFPHTARSCRFFEADENAMAAFAKSAA